MANQTNMAKKPQKEPKFLLGRFFTDADVVTEPEEPAKVVVAGMAEARIKKEYPGGYFKKAAAVLRGDFQTLIRSTLWFLPAALVFILVLLVAAPFFKTYVIGDGYNFMGNVGIGYPGATDSISAVTAKLYWDVYQPLLMMLAGAGIIIAPFMAGLFYCAKRSYYQDFYKRVTRTFFMGFAKYWWKFLITATVGILIMLAMGTALLYQLSAQQLGTSGAGSICAVVFTFLFGAPMLTVPMVMLSLFATYGLSLKNAFKNSIVIIANNPFTVILTGLFSCLPLLLLIVNNIFAIIICVAMAIVGFMFWSLCWVALADRTMTKCKALKAYEDKKKAVSARAVHVKSASGAKAAQHNKKQPPKPYQNPKKKKKK